MKKHSLNRKECLKSRKVLSRLFEDGKHFYKYPLMVQFKISKSDLNQVAFTASKRKFSKAVDRNLLKRRMREAYRLNKSILQSSNNHFSCLFIYTAKSVESFDKIERSIIKLLRDLSAR